MAEVENGFVGAAEDMGGKAEPLVVVLSAGLLSSFFEKALNGEGAAFDIGGNAVVLDDLSVGL